LLCAALTILYPEYVYDGKLGPRPSGREIDALVARDTLSAHLGEDDARIVAEFALRLASGRGSGEIQFIRVSGPRVRVEIAERSEAGTPFGIGYTLQKRKGIWRVETATEWVADY
jgi:hypothetical protein